MPTLRPHCHDFYTFLRLICVAAHELLADMIWRDRRLAERPEYYQERLREIVMGMQKVVRLLIRFQEP